MKYLVKWTKQGSMKYISHLDIMRLFQRALKRTDIKLRYSEGYSPHPKMSIAQPLSLGYTSRGEYIEFETQTDLAAEDILGRLAGAMPEGIDIVSCSVLKDTKKAMGAIITKGEYLIGCDEAKTGKEIKALCEDAAYFKSMEKILVKKVQKKSGKETEVDIRAKVRSITVEEASSERALIRVVVDTGSNSHLNPELIIVKLKEYMGEKLQGLEFHVQREEMYTESEKGELIPLYLLG